MDCHEVVPTSHNGKAGNLKLQIAAIPYRIPNKNHLFLFEFFQLLQFGLGESFLKEIKISSKNPSSLRSVGALQWGQFRYKNSSPPLQQVLSG